jgi:uncharacterized protein (DUF362 family)/Pyruvate/2-oxoacid:ferredoxin oxidoreductase delta subunit
MPKVSLIRCEDYAPAHVRQALTDALAPLGGLDFVKPGMRIAIKANLITTKHYDAAATTHPVMLAQLCALIRERGAQPIVGDSPGGPFLLTYLKTTYHAAGMAMVEKAGGILNYNTASREAEFPDGKILKKITYTDWLASCDAVITFAKLKTHAMLGLTAAVKNQFGIVPGVMKSEFHSLYPKVPDFCNMLIDLNEFIKPSLALIDGVMAMEGNGPAAGKPRKLGYLIASDSVYHADVAAAEIIGRNWTQLPLLAAAVERGLAPKSAAQLDLVGKIENFRVSDFDNLDIGGVSFGGSENSVLMRAVRNLVARRPHVDREKCVGCGLCAKNCPRSAVEMKRKLPRFDVQTCIRCFCCQELCPKEAISVKTTLLSRILN